MSVRNSLIAIAVVVFLYGAEAQAQDAQPAAAPTKPLLELGVGAGGIYSPDYPAADHYSLHGLVLPSVIYRGKFFQMGRGSIAKGIFFDNEYAELNVSLAASFNANSRDNTARQGMPNLDYLAEIGPQVKIRLGEWYGGKTELQLPVRAVFSTDFGRVDHRGYRFNPNLFHKRNNIFDSGIDMDSTIGPIFATKKLQDYFYQVEPRFATATRPAYEADGGYLGSELTLGLSYGVTDRVRVYVGGHVGYYGGAANENSPLFRQNVNSSIYLAIRWMIFQSDTRVISDD